MSEDRANLLRALAIDRAGVRPATAQRGWPGRLLLGLASVVGVLAGAWAFLPQTRVGGRAAEPVSVPAEVVRSAQRSPASPLTEPQATAGLTASGYVVARRKATVAAEVTGKVVELLVEEGMVVEAGQVVARLDSLLAETDLTLARSRATGADAAAAAVAADLADAERILNRIRSLSQKSIASEADLTKAEARVGILRAQLSQAEAQKQTAELEVQRNATVLDKHKIRAPFGGIVVERSAQPGEMISPISAGGGFTRTGICTIVDMDSIEIEVDVNEAFIGRVRSGGAISAVLDAYPDWTIPAVVVAVVPTANREKATVKVRIALKRKDPRVLPDMAVKVRFHEEENAAASPPAAAASASK